MPSMTTACLPVIDADSVLVVHPLSTPPIPLCRVTGRSERRVLFGWLVTLHATRGLATQRVEEVRFDPHVVRTIIERFAAVALGPVRIDSLISSGTNSRLHLRACSWFHMRRHVTPLFTVYFACRRYRVAVRRVVTHKNMYGHSFHLVMPPYARFFMASTPDGACGTDCSVALTRQAPRAS